MKAHFQGGNRITLLHSAAGFFPALLAAIAAAREEIYLETYIFAPDDTGLQVVQALTHAAQRGVKVRVIVDGFGSARFVATLLPQLNDIGITVLVYRPGRSPQGFHKRQLRRLHRKLFVADGRLAIVGGINIENDLPAPRLDYAVQVEGPLLQAIHNSARRLWELVAWASFKHRLAVDVPQWQADNHPGALRAAFVVRDNIRHRRDIEVAYLDAIALAREEVLIANAYFLPGRAFTQALIEASQRGVQVTVLLQGRVEYPLQHYATQALYDRLLAHGVRIVEYTASFLHAKVAVVDSRWATVGSSNIDPFSLLLAREANVVVKDRAFAGTLKASLDAAMAAGGTPVSAAQWGRRSTWARLVSQLAYALTRLLIGLVGYRLDSGAR